MSTMKTNIAKREKSLMAAKAIGSLMAIAVLAIVIFSTNVVTQADEMGADGTAVLATASDAVQSGVIQDEDGYFRYGTHPTLPSSKRISFHSRIELSFISTLRPS